LESLTIPTTIEIFGENSDGTPIVNVDGTYADGIEKDIILHRCYRTPRPVLLAAHIFGMGLLRPGGAVQFIPKPGGWEDIGYEIVSGVNSNKFEAGQEVAIRRPKANSPHPLEDLVGFDNLVSWKHFSNRESELDWIAEQIKSNVEDDELEPEEIAVISLDWRKMKETDFPGLQSRLKQSGINSAQTGTRAMPKGTFAKKGHVTLSGIFPAKGNEASIIYVMGFEQVGSNSRLIVQERNMAFTAMTRARGWCILTGVGRKAENLFKEIQNILTDPDKITFKVPDPKTIQRNLDNLEYERRRNRLAQAQKLMTKLDRVLEDDDFKDLDPALRQRLVEKLKGK